MPGAQVSLGLRLTEVGALQVQINELQAALGIQSILQLPIGSYPALVAGNPISLETNGSGGTVGALATAGANHFPPAGIMIPNPNGSGLALQLAGTVTLPIADWDAIIDGSSTGGLTPFCWYYVSSTPGNITQGVVPPGATELAQTTSSPVGARLGYAISDTQMVLAIGGQPNTITVPNGGAVTTGMAVTLNGTGQAVPAQATSAAGAAVVGIAGYIDANNNVVIFTDGMMLERANWTSITGATLLTVGAAYYLSAATPGELVTPTPTATAGDFAVLVGIGLTTTKLAVRLGAPGYAHP
jgi:hypothetical protein